MKLAILDIDGTLTKTNDIDTECFLSALDDCFALSDIQTDWSLYKHATDAAILQEIFRNHFNRIPTVAEVEHLQNSFLAYLQRAYEHGDARFSAVEGAGDFLERMGRNTEWAYAIATGGWALTARFKLQVANLSVECPMITSDEAVSREAILEKAVEASLSFYGVEGFSRSVSIGDGVWDVKAARSLSLPFVGIGSGAGAERLAKLGASHVLPDYSDLDAVFRAMDEALEPGYGEARVIIDG